MLRQRAVRPDRILRRSLMMGAAAICAPLLLTAPVALAQDAGSASVQSGERDGLAPEAVYIEADTATRDGDLITALGGQNGRVLARYRNTTLRAGEVSYDLNLGVASGRNQVEYIDPEGNVVHASYLSVDSDLRAGIAVDFATRFSNGASLMAASAVRRSQNVSELNYALFTPCPICDENGQPKEPTISVQAETVVQDTELRAILYRNAVFRVGGVPVLYLPWFAHPDPTVERASGFLAPVISYDQDRGVSAETPYLFVISPSEDVLVSPQFNWEVAPFLNLQWRRRFEDGTITARAGYTYERNFGDFDANDDGIPDIALDRDSRSYLLADGRFDPQGPWRWGFTAERTSDKTLFDRYDIRDPYQDNGLYYGDERRLISQLYAERQTQRSYLSIAAFDIQSLRIDQVNDAAPGLNTFEADSSLPLVAPIVEARWEPNGPILGGRLRLRGSAVAMYRDAYVGGPVLRPEVIPPIVAADEPGVDTRRVTGQAEWRRALISPMGVRWEPFVDARFDLYSVDELPASLGLDSETISRGRATAGLDVSYPMIRRFSNGLDVILEPMAQISTSTVADLDSSIPIEDSQTLELDESSLFRTDRFPGYDLYEGGIRFTAGLRATWRWDEGREASLFVGRSMRDADESAFRIPVPDTPAQLYDPSGLADQTTDWVVQGSFTPTDRIRGWGHAVIDGSGDIRRAEAAVDAGWGRRNLASISYIVDRSNPVSGPLNRNYQFMQVSVQQFLYRNWGVAGAGVYDFERQDFARSEIGLLFDDDCFRFEIGFRRDNTRVRPSGPSEGVYVRLNLATFGATGYGQGGRRW